MVTRYDLTCENGHRFEVDIPAIELYETRCSCGAACRQSERPFVPGGIGAVKRSRQLPDKRTSVTEWHNERDVARMREEFGGVAANCIKDDGSVVFNTAADRKAYAAAKKDYAKRRRQQSLDREGKEIARSEAPKKDIGFLQRTGKKTEPSVRCRNPKRLVGPGPSATT